MKTRNRLLLASAVVALVGGCASGDEARESTRQENTVEAPLSETSIGGIVTTIDGKALAGATVSLPSGQKVTTADDGSFLVTGLEPTERLPVTIKAPGYASTVRIYSVEAGENRSLRIPLQALEAPVTFSAELGTTLELPGGSTLEILPNSLVTVDKGVLASGDIRAVRANWEATNPAILAAAPGDFTAREPDGSTQLLQSFGMFRVKLTNARGQQLTFMPERPGLIRLPVTEQFNGLPLDRVGLYAFEPSTGVWLQDQVLTLDSAGTVLQGTLSTTNADWNYDMVMDTTCIIVKVLLNSHPAPLPGAGATAEAEGNDYNGNSTGFADSNGDVCLNVRKNSSVTLSAVWDNGPSHWMMITPPTLNPTPSNTARCDMDPSACTVITDPLILDLITRLP